VALGGVTVSDPVLMIAPGAVRGASAAEVYWPGDGRRVSIGTGAMRIASEFAIPDTAEGVVARLEETAPGSSDTVRRAITSMLAAGVLCEFRPPADRRTGLFGAPVMDLAEAVTARADFVVVGAPYDHGASYRPGSRFAPAALRQASTTVFQVDGDRRGMYDVEQDCRVLANASIADIGDLVGTLGGLGRDILDGLEDTVSVVTAPGLVPVVLGGDHSITLRVVDGLTRHHRRLGVLHLDAHHDHGRIRTGVREGVHHGNFLDWVLGNPAVECVAQFGVRQLVADSPEHSDKLVRWPGMTAPAADPDEIRASLPDDLVWHVSFDVDVLDPSVMPATGTMLPGGYSYHEAVRLLAGLADRLPIVGVDIVEFLPGADDAPGVTIAGLLVRLMDRIYRRAHHA
jgi:agmatinase